MDKMNFHIIRCKNNGLIWCIGSDFAVNNLRSIKFYGKLGVFVDFIVNNGVYCYFDDICMDDCDMRPCFERIKSSGLIIGRKLVFEAMILMNPDKIDDILGVLGWNDGKNGIYERYLGEILVNSWWLDKFEV